VAGKPAGYYVGDARQIVMKKCAIELTNQIEIENIRGFLIRKVTKFGNSAKVDCPKEYIGQTVYLVITNQKDTDGTGEPEDQPEP